MQIHITSTGLERRATAIRREQQCLPVNVNAGSTLHRIIFYIFILMYENYKSDNSYLWKVIPRSVRSFADCRFEHPKAQQQTIL